MATRVTRKQAAKFLGYCNQQLADKTISDDRRQMLEEKAAFYRRALVGHCTDCGRALEDASQPGYKLGLGPDCYRNRLDADDREYDRAVDHQLSFQS